MTVLVLEVKTTRAADDVVSSSGPGFVG